MDYLPMIVLLRRFGQLGMRGLQFMPRIWSTPYLLRTIVHRLWDAASGKFVAKTRQSKVRHAGSVGCRSVFVDHVVLHQGADDTGVAEHDAVLRMFSASRLTPTGRRR